MTKPSLVADTPGDVEHHGGGIGGDVGGAGAGDLHFHGGPNRSEDVDFVVVADPKANEDRIAAVGTPGDPSAVPVSAGAGRGFGALQVRMVHGDSPWRSDPEAQYVRPPHQSTGPAAQQWAEALAAWAIPVEILAAAPQSPYGFDVGMFARLADEALDRETPSQQVAREALSDGGSVLDVGCGGGAASLPLAPPATLIVGLDQDAGMLQAFAQRAAARGVAQGTLEGAWPDVAARAPVVDVVVCHNVFYNVSDLRPFVQRLTEHARGRVVVQLTQHHPLSWLNPLWKELHGLDRPDSPTADDAAAVVREAGFDPIVQHWTGPMKVGRTGDELVAFVRQRLCLGSERDPRIRKLIERHPPPARRPTATLWWSPPRPSGLAGRA